MRKDFKITTLTKKGTDYNMANQYGAKPIVTEGLVFYTDGKDTSSNSGTTITDIMKKKSGTLTGSPTLSGTYAPTFDGSGDRIDFGGETTSDDFAFGTGDFTIESWFRYSGGNFNSGPYYIDMRAQGEQSAAKIALYIPSGKLNWFVNNGSWDDGSESLSVNTWYHVVATRVSSTRYFYVNGTQTNSEGSHTTSYVASRPRLGARANLSATQYWNGNIPIVRIYKGKGFTSSDVSQNFNAQRDRFGV